jgi:hypothetical protein
MATSKLTLSIEPECIEKAKSYTTEQNTSVSKLFKDFIKEVSDKKEKMTENSVLEFKNVLISDDIKSLTGILKENYPDDITLWEAKYEYLKEKHNL